MHFLQLSPDVCVMTLKLFSEVRNGSSSRVKTFFTWSFASLSLTVHSRHVPIPDNSPTGSKGQWKLTLDAAGSPTVHQSQRAGGGAAIASEEDSKPTTLESRTSQRDEAA
jgi:hypothetical protein